MGVYEYARAHGVHVPATAARQLIAMSDGREAPISNRIDLATSLVVRESTAPPRVSVPATS